MTATASPAIDIDVPADTASTTPPSPPVPLFSPLLGAHLRIRVDIPSPPNSPFPPAWAVVVPFTPAEGVAYLDALKPFAGKAVERDAEVRKRLVERVKEWNYTLPSMDTMLPTTAAPINPGTMAAVPSWAVDRIEAAVFGEGGKLLGN